MKKVIISAILTLALLLNIAACNKNSNATESTSAQQTTQTTQSNQKPDEEKTVYDALNALSEQHYSKIKLNISTLTGDIQLTAQYVMTANDIAYSVEQLNLFPADGNFSNLSPEYKTMLTGTAVIENGKITSTDGDKVSLPEYNELKGSFHFKESCFANVKNDDGKFSADVPSASAFLGTNKNAKSVTAK